RLGNRHSPKQEGSLYRAGRALEIEEHRAGAIIHAMRDDRNPKIPARRNINAAENQTNESGDEHSKRSLVTMGRAKNDALHQASGDPADTASSEKHGEAVKQKASEHELFIQP